MNGEIEFLVKTAIMIPSRKFLVESVSMMSRQSAESDESRIF